MTVPFPSIALSSQRQADASEFQVPRRVNTTKCAAEDSSEGLYGYFAKMCVCLPDTTFSRIVTSGSDSGDDEPARLNLDLGVDNRRTCHEPSSPVSFCRFVNSPPMTPMQRQRNPPVYRVSSQLEESHRGVTKEGAERGESRVLIRNWAPRLSLDSSDSSSLGGQRFGVAEQDLFQRGYSSSSEFAVPTSPTSVVSGFSPTETAWRGEFGSPQSLQRFPSLHSTRSCMSTTTVGWTSDVAYTPVPQAAASPSQHSVGSSISDRSTGFGKANCRETPQTPTRRQRLHPVSEGHWQE